MANYKKAYQYTLSIKVASVHPELVVKLPKSREMLPKRGLPTLGTGVIHNRWNLTCFACGKKGYFAKDCRVQPCSPSRVVAQSEASKVPKANNQFVSLAGRTSFQPRGPLTRSQAKVLPDVLMKERVQTLKEKSFQQENQRSCIRKPMTLESSSSGQKTTSSSSGSRR